MRTIQATCMTALMLSASCSPKVGRVPTSTSDTDDLAAHPTASSSSVTTLEDTPLSIILAAASGAGKPLTFTVVVPPAHGGLTSSDAASGTFIYAPAANFNGSDALAFKVSEDGLDSELATVSITVTPVNDAPVVAAVSLGSGPYFHDATLNATPSGATDIEGDTVTFHYAWFVNDTVVAGATNATLSGVPLAKGDKVFARVTPDDSATLGAAVDSNVVTIANSAPSFTSAAIAGSAPYFDNAPLAVSTAGWSDVDGDDAGYAYQWYVNGTPLAAPRGVAATLSPPDFARGDEVYCAVTAYDGTESGNTVSTAAVTLLDGTAPYVESVGAKDHYLLSGVVVTPDMTFVGEVLVEAGVITCVEESCAGEPGAAGATVIATRGMIFPGLIDAHNHIQYDVFDESDWAPIQIYANHNYWTTEPGYSAMIDCSDYLHNVAATPPPGGDLTCEVEKYGEIKGLITGTTSILGEPGGGARKCYASLARSIDGSFNELPALARPLPCTDPASSDHIKVSPLGLVGVNEVALKAEFDTCKTWSFVVHIGEGLPTNASAYAEWTSLMSKGLDVPQVSIVHGTALGLTEFQHMADNGMKLIWSPKSNMSLYGQTTSIDLARQVTGHLTIALAPDWSLTGSVNLLDELNYAHDLAEGQWPGVLLAKDLVEMVTIEAARALEIQNQVGSIEVGKLADLIVVTGDTSQPYDALVQARPHDVRLVMVNGQVLYGDAALQAAASLTECESVDICGESRFLCVKEQATTDKLSQTYADITAAIDTALTDYDTSNGTHFSPIAPLVKCP